MPFKPGQSGNPAGRKPLNLDEQEVRTLARAYTTQAINKLVEWLKSDNAKASVSAATALLDRGWGKPQQTVVADVTQYIVHDDRLSSIRSGLREAEEPEARTVQ